MLYNSFGNWAEGVTRPCEHQRPQSSSSSTSSSSSNNNYESTSSSASSNFYYQHSLYTATAATGDHLLSGGDWCHDQQSSSSSVSSPSSAADTEFSDWFYQPETIASGRPFSTNFSSQQLWDLTLTGKLLFDCLFFFKYPTGNNVSWRTATDVIDYRVCTYQSAHSAQ